MKSRRQLDMYGWTPITEATKREEESFGYRDALCGLPFSNHYSNRISGERLAAYERGYRKGQREDGLVR